MERCEQCDEECVCATCNHVILRDELTTEIDKLLEPAIAEFHYLSHLFQDVCWYNFEVSAQKWKHPWPVVMPDSAVYLAGTRVSAREVNGHLHEQVTFPEYYSGYVCDAPPLPPAIVLKELKDAHQRMLELRDAALAVYNLAPCGREYTELQKSTLVGRVVDTTTSELLDAVNGVHGENDGSRTWYSSRGGYADAFGHFRRYNRRGRHGQRI